MLRNDKINLVCLTYSGAIDFDKNTPSSTLPSYLAECLQDIQAGHVTVDGNRVSYRNDIYRVAGRWNVVGPFGSGELEVDSATRQVRYRLSVAQMIVSSIVLFGFVGALLLCGSSSKFGTGVFLVLGWMLVIGGNLLIGIPRFKAFLRRSISTAPAG